jgi:hypothetical protein
MTFVRRFGILALGVLLSTLGLAFGLWHAPFPAAPVSSNYTFVGAGYLPDSSSTVEPFLFDGSGVWLIVIVVGVGLIGTWIGTQIAIRRFPN